MTILEIYTFFLKIFYFSLFDSFLLSKLLTKYLCQYDNISYILLIKFYFIYIFKNIKNIIQFNI